ncbi:TIGR02642 family protein [Vibrio metschnikovii]|uniref:TIGR02642 family protein n=1 Tax=Vibrio metschnikovii TaxID=28172 RepID=UPI00164BA18E|nr:TIGR02642 family protein [Vibrio metschnikovii]MBC5832261.1 hypothetical protein [Vibrio metschnikovii]
MNYAVELLSKLHSPKPIFIERKSGRTRLTPDVILGAISTELHGYPVGRVIIEARYLNDLAAEKTLSAHILDKVKQEHVAHTSIVAHIVYCLVMQKPLHSQRVKLRSLHKQYGGRAKRSQKLISTWRERIKSMERSGNAKLQYMIDRHLDDIEKEKQQLLSYAELKASQSLNCPKCGGTGISANKGCDACDGIGYFKPTRERIYSEFRQMGARITEQDFTRTYQPVITDLVSFYCQCELNAADALENRLMAERTVL